MKIELNLPKPILIAADYRVANEVLDNCKDRSINEMYNDLLVNAMGAKIARDLRDKNLIKQKPRTGDNYACYDTTFGTSIVVFTKEQYDALLDEILDVSVTYESR